MNYTKISISNVFLCLSLFLLLFLPFTISFWNMFISSNLLKYFCFAALIIFALLSEKKVIIKRHSIFRFEFLMWLIFIIIAFYKNFDIAFFNNYFQFFYYITLFVFAIIFSNKDSSWIDLSINILKLFCFIHLLSGYFCWFNRDFFVSKIVPLMNLNANTLNILIDCVHKGYLTGMTYHYSTMGMYMSLGVLLYSDWVISSDVKERKKKLFFFITYCITLALTGKRGPLLFSIVSFSAVYLKFFDIKKKKIFNRFFFVFLSFFIFLFSLYIFVPQISNSVNRFFISNNINDLSTGRIEFFWKNAIGMWHNNMFFGNGWRSFRYQIIYYANVNNNDAHNIYLQILCETGIVGFCFILAFFIRMLLKNFYLLKDSNLKNKQHILFICACYQLFFLMYGFTGNPLYDCQCFVPLFLIYSIIINLDNTREVIV